MLVSVVLPTFNRAKQLARALDSVLAQTYGQFEVLVVDDGSTDETSGVIEGRYHDEPRVVYLRQEHAGVARARNTALERARGEVIAFLDSDDEWRPWKLAFQLECLQRTPEAGMVWTDMDAVDAAGNLMPECSLRDILSAFRRFPLSYLFDQQIALEDVASTPPSLRTRSLYVGDVFGKMVIGNLVLPSSALVTRERLDRVGRFDESLSVSGEDFDFFLRICREGPVAFADVPSTRKQLGQSDQLTHPSRTLDLARNYLRTMNGALERDPDRVDLPPKIVRAARADGHAWTGRAYLEVGDRASARRHLRQAMRLRPLDAKTLVAAGLALLPAAISARALGSLAGVKTAVGRLSSRRG